MTQQIVAFTANNRPDYLRETLATWRRVRGIDKAHVIFRVEPGHPEVLELCQGSGLGAQLDVIENPTDFGALDNPWHAFETGFATGASFGTDFVILAEDDSPVSSDVLEYFAWAQENFRRRPFVLAVCALQRQRQAGGQAGVLLQQNFCPTVWGTWLDCWTNLLSPDWDHDYSHKGWDWRINEYWTQAMGWKCVFPAESRSQVSGQYGGTHLRPQDYEAHLSDCWEADRPPQDYKEIQCAS